MTARRLAKKRPSKAENELWLREQSMNAAVKDLASDLRQTERDQYATAALIGLCATRAQHPIHLISNMAGELAATSYVIADSMLAVRKFTGPELIEYIKSKQPQEKK